MQPATPLLVSLLAFEAAVIPVLAWLGFRRIARRAAPEVIVPSAIFIGLWITVAITLSARGFFSGGSPDSVPPIAWALLPLAIGYVAFLTLRPVRTAFDAIPMQWMIGVQLYRALGVVFLIEWVLGAVPGAFALPAGIGDLAIGLTAPLVAMRVKRGAPNARNAAILWNALGITDLVVAVTTGVLTAPGALHRLALDAPNYAIARLPLVLVPTIAVPFSLLLHFISLHRLRSGAQPSLAATYAVRSPAM